MTNPFTKPTLTGYNPSPAPDTGQAGGSANIVRWAKHTDELTDPLRDWIQAGFDAIEDAFEDIFGAATVFVFFGQASAPAGWTQQNAGSDRVLRLTSGSGDATGGSWNITGLTLPNHVHSNGSLSGTLTSGDDIDADASGGAGDRTITSNISGNTGNPTTNPAINSDGSWRPRYIDVIRCSRSFG